MGCVYSKVCRHGSRAGSSNPSGNTHRSFHAVNVNNRGEEENSGLIEVTDNDVIFRPKGGSSPIKWPLGLVIICYSCVSDLMFVFNSSLRRYGWDVHLFSFECGRRCPTGPGIYAFSCKEAEQLFNDLQEAINKCTPYNMTSYLAAAAAGVAANGGLTNNDDEVVTEGAQTIHEIRASSIPNSCSPIDDERRGSQALSSPSHSYVNSIHNYINSPIYNGSVSNNPSFALDSGPPSRPVTSCSLPGSAVTDINTNYAKLDDLVKYYVNINTPMTSSGGNRSDRRSNEVEHLPLSQIQGQKSSSSIQSSSQSSSNVTKSTTASSSRIPSRFQFPPTAAQSGMTSSTTRTNGSPDILRTPSDNVQFNYIMLDLEKPEKGITEGHIVSTCPATPVSKTPKDMVWPTEGQPSTPTSIGSAGTSEPRLPYAMIDFNKTEALTSAANQRKGLSTDVTSS